MKSQLVSLCIGSLCFVGSYSLNAQESWQSQLVIQDESGNLTYKKDNDGFVIPDFSQAGYGNGKDIPVVSLPERTITISPLEDKEADNTQHIQKAIDEVGKYALDAEGIRGVVFLSGGRCKRLSGGRLDLYKISYYNSLAGGCLVWRQYKVQHR